MKNGAVIVARLHVAQEVLDRLRCLDGVELNLDRTFAGDELDLLRVRVDREGTGGGEQECGRQASDGKRHRYFSFGGGKIQGAEAADANGRTFATGLPSWRTTPILVGNVALIGSRRSACAYDWLASIA